MARIIGNGGSTAQSASGLRGIPPSAIDRADPGHLGNVGSIKELGERYDLNPKTVMKWRSRSFVHDAPMGPTVPRSTVLTPEEDALAVAFRRHRGRRA